MAQATGSGQKRNWKAPLILLAGLIFIAVIVFFFALQCGGGDDNGGVQTQAMGDLTLEGAIFSQSGEEHSIPAGLLKGEVEDFVLEPGEVGLVLTFKTEDGDPAVGETITIVDLDTDAGDPQETDEDGVVIFLLDLTLGDEGWRQNPFRLEARDVSREFSLLAVDSITSGAVTGGDMVNTAGEMGVGSTDQPYTVGFEVDPVFVEAFVRFCGFATDQVKAVHLEPNDKQRFQVAWTGSDFVEARSVIEVGQPVWVAISTDGDRCYINPPCGNPAVPEGKLPPDPTPRREALNTPTNTPPAGNTPPPSATDTPTSTKTPKKPTATSTPKNTPTDTPTPTKTPKKPTATPPPPAQTARPTDTPPPTCCIVAPTQDNPEGGTPIAPTFTPRPTRTPLPQPTQDRPDPPRPTSVPVW